MCTIVIQKKEMLYIAHIGETRCFIHQNGGNLIKLLTKSHTPNDMNEKVRIYSYGAEVKKLTKGNQLDVYNHRPGIKNICKR